MFSTTSTRTSTYSASTDTELLDLTRAGDQNAFGEIWTRHVAVGYAIARRTTDRIDAADLVSESFARMLQAIRNGMGPRTALRAYLATTIRSVAASWGRNLRPTVDLDAVPEVPFHDERLLAIDDLDSLDKAVAAYKSLPERWQTALWHSEVEGLTNPEIAEILGLKPTAVATLTARARAGLRKAWATSDAAA